MPTRCLRACVSAGARRRAGVAAVRAWPRPASETSVVRRPCPRTAPAPASRRGQGGRRPRSAPALAVVAGSRYKGPALDADNSPHGSDAIERGAPPLASLSAGRGKGWGAASGDAGRGTRRGATGGGALRAARSHRRPRRDHGLRYGGTCAYPALRRVRAGASDAGTPPALSGAGGAPQAVAGGPGAGELPPYGEGRDEDAAARAGVRALQQLFAPGVLRSARGSGGGGLRGRFYARTGVGRRGRGAGAFRGAAGGDCALRGAQSQGGAGASASRVASVRVTDMRNSAARQASVSDSCAPRRAGHRRERTRQRPERPAGAMCCDGGRRTSPGLLL
eukprot:scaffold1486_cov329-Prasinococcus_capsulatus_cf.AAC.1